MYNIMLWHVQVITVAVGTRVVYCELHVTGYKNIESVAMKMQQCVSLLLLSHMPLLTI